MFQVSPSHFEVRMDIIHFCFFLINVSIEFISYFGCIVHHSVTNIAISTVETAHHIIVQSAIAGSISYLIVIEYECPTSIALIFI